MNPRNEETELRWNYHGWRVTLASCLAAMTGFGSILIYSFGILLKPLTGEFGWSRATISTAFACASFTLGICSPGLGFLLDRYGPRRVILPCLIIFGAAFASLSLLTNNLVQLFATFTLIGVVGNATAQMGYARAISTWFERHRGMALALLMAGSAGGAIVVPVIAQRIVVLFGWRSAYVILGAAPILVGVPLAWFFVREKAGHREIASAASLPGVEVPAALRKRAFWILAATLFLTAMSTTGTITHLSALLTDRGISVGDAAVAVSIVGGTSILGRLLTGWALDRYFGPYVATILLLMTAAGLLLLAQSRTAGLGLIAAGLIGFSMGGEADVTPYLLARYFGLRRLATLYGLTWTAYATAAALGSVLLGRAFDANGNYEALLLRLGSLTAGAGLLMMLMPRYPALNGTPEAAKTTLEARASA